MIRVVVRGCRLLVIIAAVVDLAATADAQNEPSHPPGPLDKLRAEYDEAMNAWAAKYRGDLKAPSAQLIKRYDAWPAWSFIPKVVKLGTADAKAPYAFEALRWFAVDLANGTGAADRDYFAYDEPVLSALKAHHLSNPRIVEIFGNCSSYPTPAREALLRECMESGSTREVRGLACFYLVECLQNKARLAFEMASGRFERGDAFEQHILGRWSPAYVAYVRLTDSTETLAESKSLEQRVIDEFDDVASLRGHPVAPAKPTLGFMVRLKRAQANPATIGQPAPELAGKDLDGHERKLSDFRGKIIVLHFWASWSPRCLEKLPQLQELAQRHAGDEFCILGLNHDQDRLAAVNFSRNNSLSWPSWWATDLGESIGRFSPGGTWSAVIVIDHKGVLRYQDIAGNALDKAIETLLRERSQEMAGTRR